MKPRATFEKRRKEQAKQERKKEKNARRMQRREDRSNTPDTVDGDPDIAHIVPGQSVEYDEFGNPIVPRSR